MSPTRLCLSPWFRQWSAKAVMHPVSEGDVVLIAAGNIEFVGVLPIYFGRTVRGVIGADDRISLADDKTVEIDILDGTSPTGLRLGPGGLVAVGTLDRTKVEMVSTAMALGASLVMSSAPAVDRFGLATSTACCSSRYSRHKKSRQGRRQRRGNAHQVHRRQRPSRPGASCSPWTPAGRYGEHRGALRLKRPSLPAPAWCTR
jgi:hypothetical protein